MIIDIDKIYVEDRMRKDYGDVAELASSIKSYGLIQPIVISRLPEAGKYKLVAGGRRLAALKLLKTNQLVRGTEFIIRDETDETHEGLLQLKAIELEENLRRKEMTWPEQVEGKQRLLELMQSIHGGSRGAGAPSSKEQALGETTGFGVRKLAAMLGESPALVSKDLHLATLVRAMPQLAKQESKSSAQRIGTINLALHHIKMKSAIKAASLPVTLITSDVADPTPKYDLFQGDWKDSIHTINDEEIDLIYTDLPYGVDLDKMGATENVSAHGGAISYSDDRHTIVDSLQNLAKESYRALKNHRFGVFFFGFNYYSELCGALLDAGFTINPIPVVWLKHQQFTQQPTHRYANGYEQAIIAMKGQPTFIHPGRVNIIDCPGISTAQRMQVAQQPTELVKRFILDMTLPRSGAKVLDFYSGTGTTGVAALELGQYPILFEKDPQQCSLIQNRLEQVLKQQSASSKK